MKPRSLQVKEDCLLCQDKGQSKAQVYLLMECLLEGNVSMTVISARLVIGGREFEKKGANEAYGFSFFQHRVIDRLLATTRF